MNISFSVTLCYFSDFSVTVARYFSSVLFFESGSHLKDRVIRLRRHPAVGPLVPPTKTARSQRMETASCRSFWGGLKKGPESLKDPESGDLAIGPYLISNWHVHMSLVHVSCMCSMSPSKTIWYYKCIQGAFRHTTMMDHDNPWYKFHPSPPRATSNHPIPRAFSNWVTLVIHLRLAVILGA